MFRHSVKNHTQVHTQRQTRSQRGPFSQPVSFLPFTRRRIKKKVTREAEGAVPHCNPALPVGSTSLFRSASGFTCFVFGERNVHASTVAGSGDGFFGASSATSNRNKKQEEKKDGVEKVTRIMKRAPRNGASMKPRGV